MSEQGSPGTIQDVIAVLSGNKDVAISIEDRTMLILLVGTFIVVFLAVALANVLTR